MEADGSSLEPNLARKASSISESVAKIFTRRRGKSKNGFIDRLEEPEMPLSLHTYSETSLRGPKVMLEGAKSLQSPKSRSSEFKRPEASPGSGFHVARQSLSPLRSGELAGQGSLMQEKLQLRTKSLLETPKRQELAFKSYSLPAEFGAELPLQPLLPLNQEYPSLGDFKILKTIGRGTFARVLAVQHTQTGRILAMKVLKKINVLRRKQLQHVLSEKSILARINHPFIVRLHSAYQDREKLYLLMEFASGGELFTHKTDTAQVFGLEAARFYTASILLALEYLHANSVIYRDLKPENLLLDERGFLKVTDLGFAKEISRGDRTYTQCGTPQYLAPEIIRKEGHDKAVDWWSMGVILYEMLTGKLPFLASHHPALFKLIMAGAYEIPAHVDPEAQDLIRKLIVVDASERLGSSPTGSQEIKRHPFFKDFSWRDLITGKATPPERPSLQGCPALDNFQSFEESQEDPTSPVLDRVSAEVVFRAF